MSIALNQTAPAAEATKGADFVRLDPFPRSDSYVLTITAFNFIPSYPFKRKDDSGVEYVKAAPAVEFFFGGMVDGKPYFAKTWPKQYSVSDRSTYYAIYNAAAGKPPEAGSNVADILGKFLLVPIEVENKKSSRGKAYTVSKVGDVSKVPSILANTGTPIEQLKPALDAALAAQGEKEVAPF